MGAPEDPSREGGSQGFPSLPRHRWFSSPQRTVWQRWEKKVLRSLCLQIRPSQQIKGKSATITSQPDANKIPQNSWSQRGFAAPRCALRPPPRPPAVQGPQLLWGFSLEKPFQGKVGWPQKSPEGRVSWGKRSSTPTQDTLRLPEHPG